MQTTESKILTSLNVKYHEKTFRLYSIKLLHDVCLPADLIGAGILDLAE
jgi:hypothetical protein